MLARISSLPRHLVTELQCNLPNAEDQARSPHHVRLGVSPARILPWSRHDRQIPPPASRPWAPPTAMAFPLAFLVPQRPALRPRVHPRIGLRRADGAGHHDGGSRDVLSPLKSRRHQLRLGVKFPRDKEASNGVYVLGLIVRAECPGCGYPSTPLRTRLPRRWAHRARVHPAVRGPSGAQLREGVAASGEEEASQGLAGVLGRGRCGVPRGSIDWVHRGVVARGRSPHRRSWTCRPSPEW